MSYLIGFIGETREKVISAKVSRKTFTRFRKIEVRKGNHLGPFAIIDKMFRDIVDSGVPINEENILSYIAEYLEEK